MSGPNWGSIPDWVAALSSIATTIIAGVAGYFGVRTFQHQRTSFDIQLALSIFENINRYWDRITDDNANHFEYDIGQILAQFEMAANLFNNKVLTNAALPILKDHIVEVYTSIITADGGGAIIERCRSSPETFKELRKFLREFTPTALNALSFNEKP